MVRCLNCMKEYDEQYEVCPHCGFIRGTPPREAYHLHPGTLLYGRYVIGTVLGFGGFGITYRAWDSRLERQVAIKEFYPGGIVNRIPGERTVIVYTGNREDEFRKGKERFLTEARYMAKFNQHPNIVHVFEFFEENNTAYIAMEFLDGISYRQYIKEHWGRVNTDMAVSVVVCAARALADIHKLHIIHRDVSPDNIFICKGGTIKLIDFGAARFSSGETEKTLSIILKPGYAPPEQYRNKSKQGPWTDVYALGAVLYRSLTGEMPDESVNRVQKDNLKAPKEINPDIPEYLNDSIMRAMALNPELRFQSMGAFIKAIENTKKARSLEKEIARRKRLRLLGAAGTAVILCAGAVACVAVYRGKRQEAYGLKADLEFWIPEGNAGEAYREAIAAFNEYYQDIHIEIKEIPEDTYQETWENAGEKPDIFDSTGMDPEKLKAEAGSLTALGQKLHEKQYYFLEEIGGAESELYQIPLGFEMPVIYLNVGMEQEEGTPSRKEEIESWIRKGNFSMKEEDEALYENCLETLNLSGEQSPKMPSDFYSEETPVFLGTTEDYEEVQKRLTGRYEVVWPEEIWSGEAAPKARFSNELSISGQLSGEEKESAQEFIDYLVSERGQDILNVRGGAALPINRDMYEEYVGINGELEKEEAGINSLEILNWRGKESK